MKHILTFLLLISPVFAATDMEWQQKAAALIQSAREDARQPEATPTPSPTPEPRPSPTPLPTPTPTPTPDNKWSNPDTWPGGKVPDDGADVTIPEGKTILLDQNISTGAIIIDGRLEIPHTATITASYILAQHGGGFYIGSKDEPLPANETVTVTLNGTNKLAVKGMGGRLLGAMMGGHIELYGAAPPVSWTMLNNNALPDTDSITLAEKVDWQPGSRIIVTSTGWNFEETEERKVISVDGMTVKLDKPLKFYHCGEIKKFPNPIKGTPQAIDKRAEVGLLTRNIRIQGADDSDALGGYGGHVMIMDPESVGIFSGVEFYKTGQAGAMGRYSLHYHRVIKGGFNGLVENCSINYCYNRGLVDHHTDGLTVLNVVIYGTYGHGIFFEDGGETECTIDHCLIAGVYESRLSPAGISLDSMPDFLNPLGFVAGIWVSNPNNTITNNAIAGTSPFGNGLWLEYRPTLHQGSISYAEDPTYNPQLQPFGRIENNRIHSQSGIEGSNVSANGAGVWVSAGPTNVHLEGLTIFSCAQEAFWSGGFSNNVTVSAAAIESGRHAFLNRTDTNVFFSLMVLRCDDQDDSPFRAQGIDRSMAHLYEGHGGNNFIGCWFDGFNTDDPTPATLTGYNPKINDGRDSFVECGQNTCELGIWCHEDFPQLVVHDPDNLFENPSAGTFISSPNLSEWLRDPSCLDAESDPPAKGIPAGWKARNRTFADSKLLKVWWSPHSYVQSTFTAGAPTEGLLIKRGDGPELTATTNYITTHMMVGPTYEVSGMDGSALSSGSVSINAAAAGDALTWSVKWATSTVQARAITNMANYPNEDSVITSASMDEFQTAKGAAAFVESGMLNLRLPVEVGAAASMRFTP